MLILKDLVDLNQDLVQMGAASGSVHSILAVDLKVKLYSLIKPILASAVPIPSKPDHFIFNNPWDYQYFLDQLSILLLEMVSDEGLSADSYQLCKDILKINNDDCFANAVRDSYEIINFTSPTVTLSTGLNKECLVLLRRVIVTESLPPFAIRKSGNDWVASIKYAPDLNATAPTKEEALGKILAKRSCIQICKITRDGLQTALKSLYDLSQIKHGWYSKEEGQPISKRQLRKAHSVIYALNKQMFVLPYVYPTIEGGLSLEWFFQNSCVDLVLVDDYSNGAISFVNTDTQYSCGELPRTEIDLINSCKKYLWKATNECKDS